MSGSRGWVTSGKPNSLGSPLSVSSIHVAAAVVGAVDAAVVLLVERVRLAGRHGELVDALPGDRDTGLGYELGADADVARLPRRAAVARLEHADRGDPDPGPRRVGRVGDDRVQDQAAGARAARSAGVGWFGQALDVRPGRAAVVAPEQPGRLDAGEQRAVRGRREAPDRRDRLGRRRRRSCPADEWVHVAPRSSLRQTAGPNHGLPAAARMAPLARLDDEVVDRPALAQRPAHGPVATRLVALEDERPLLGPDEQQCLERSSIVVPQPPALNG